MLPKPIRGLGLACLAIVAGLAAAPAAAGVFEGVLAPGPVIQGHARNEADCASCHVRFDKVGQDRLCIACHKDIGQDLQSHSGYHGRMRPQECRACHTDHKGREAKVVVLDERQFDHALTRFALHDAHQKVECARCHVPGKQFRAAAKACIGCHRKDDVHKARLGEKCADCHNEKSWKEARFDHDGSRFPLRDRHVDVKCTACHLQPDFRNAPLTCIGCHRKDDKHQGRYGEKCETCHNAADWKKWTFDHDRETRYPLRFAHLTTSCSSCHRGDLYRDKLSTECVACHRKDDKHKGSEGDKCGSCHTERNWKEARFNHEKTKFPLRGGHERVECKSCHLSAVFTDAPLACNGCHQKDDKHKGRFGSSCEKCHNEDKWRTIIFNHDRDTKYPLRGKHQPLRCDACHTGSLAQEKLQSDCIACHRKDDKHKGQEGERCGQCHNESDWKSISRFDHALSRFPLLGKHEAVKCSACHLDKQFKDARTECVACHEKDDRHKRSLGAACESCHDARDWKSVNFDHDARTRFPLDGAHRDIACAACHRAPVKGRALLPMDCVACHRGDDVHDGNFGDRCERCHDATRWSRVKARLSRADVRGRDPRQAGGAPMALAAALPMRSDEPDWGGIAAWLPVHDQ